MSITETLQRLVGTPDPADVVKRCGPQVYRHLRRIFGPHADIDDAYQAVFMEVLRSLPTFRGRSKLSTWIRSITWNVAYQEMRMNYRQQRFVDLDEGAVASGARAPDEEVADRDTMRRLYQALEMLDPRQRAVVVMHDIEGKTLKEIGHNLGRPLPTVASQLYAGRERMARIMRGRGGAAPRPRRISQEITP